jgi:hypothetical protein
MPSQKLSQRTIVAVIRTLRDHGSAARGPNIGELLYEHDFPDWFVTHSRNTYNFEWGQILPEVRNTQFFFPHSYFSAPGANITGVQYMSSQDAEILGESLLRQLAAFAATLPSGQSVERSLELDGLRVDKKNLKLLPFDSLTSEREEEERVASFVNQSGLTNSKVVLQHIGDARDLFVQQKDHPSIGEARNFLQSLIDGISGDTHAHGGHAIGHPGGTANRLKYLEDVGFFTADEKTAVGAAWGFLSAGTHPGIPSRDEARIALILSLEFGVMLLVKFQNWKANAFRAFS